MCCVALQICDTSRSNGGVFTLTMFLVDKFVIQRRSCVRRESFQLIGAVCLLVSSKFTNCSDNSSLTAQHIVQYADQSFTKQQLLVSSYVSLYGRNPLTVYIE